MKTGIDPDAVPGDFEGGISEAELRELVSAIGPIVARAGLDLSRGLTIVIDPPSQDGRSDAALLVGWQIHLPVPESDWDAAFPAYLDGCRTFEQEGVFWLLYDRTGSAYYAIPRGAIAPRNSIRLGRFHRDPVTRLWHLEAK